MKNNFEKSSTTIILNNLGEDIPSRYSVSMIWTFDYMENKHNTYREEDCTKTFCIPLRKGQQKLYVKKKVCYLLKH